jgi:hypothetical protein
MGRTTFQALHECTEGCGTLECHHAQCWHDLAPVHRGQIEASAAASRPRFVSGGGMRPSRDSDGIGDIGVIDPAHERPWKNRRVNSGQGN